MYLALTGNKLKGRDVYEAGLATRMVHSNMLAQLEEEIVSLNCPTPKKITNASDVTKILYKYRHCTIDSYSI